MCSLSNCIGACNPEEQGETGTNIDEDAMETDVQRSAGEMTTAGDFSYEDNDECMLQNAINCLNFFHSVLAV